MKMQFEELMSGLDNVESLPCSSTFATGQRQANCSEGNSDVASVLVRMRPEQ